MSFRVLAALAFALCNIAVCNAQDNLTGAISLRDAISATLAENPELRSFPFRQEALLGERTTAGQKPALSFNAGIDDAIGTGALKDLRGAEATLSFSQVVELGDQQASRVNVVNRRLELLNAEQRITELNLIAEVTFRYIEVAEAEQRVALQVKASELAEQTLTVLEPLVRAGQTPQLELMRAKALIGTAKMAERAAAANLESTKINLSSMWADHNPKFDTTDANLLDVGEAGSITPILIQLSSNPDIEIYAREERLLEAQWREARSQRRKDIEWTAGIRHLRELDDTGFMLNVKVPLFSGNRQTGAIKTANANMAAVQARRDAALNSMQGQLHSLHRQLSIAIAEVDTLRREVLPLLSEALSLTREAYQAGRYSYLELASAQHDYLDAELTLITSAANAHTLRAEIERLSGASLAAQ